MVEKLDRHIRDSALRKFPLHKIQHAYKMGNSTETALHNVTTRIENVVEHKDNASGAFDRTSFDTKLATERQ
jgi:hypothetical protein